MVVHSSWLKLFGVSSLDVGFTLAVGLYRDDLREFDLDGDLLDVPCTLS